MEQVDFGGTSVNLQFDPEKISAAQMRISTMAAELQTMQDTLQSRAKYLKENWDTTSSYGYLWNMFIPMYKEINVMKRSLESISNKLMDVSALYSSAKTVVGEKVDDLPTESIVE